jgi:hypothetical protein
MRQFAIVLGLVLAGSIAFSPTALSAADVAQSSRYSLLDPIHSGNLTVFPVVSSKSYDTGDFITLDEGIRSGDVVVTEAGQNRGLIRRHPDSITAPPVRDAEVNRLVLVNNSKKPLLLLAGEIVTGGKQDRVIGRDRIVPPESDPVDLSVFCVEPGRWVPTNGKNDFSAGRGIVGGLVASPSVRGSAMAEKNQQQVWDNVAKSKEAMAAAPMVATDSSAMSEVSSTSSYARVMENKDVQKQVDSVAAPIERNYESVIHQLRDKNAVGVVVAVNGEIVWADIFASTQLLQKYWPKLIRSYATEAVITRAKAVQVSTKEAQRFLDNVEARREVSEIEPGVYKQTEISGDGFKLFELTSLLPKTGFPVHIAKMVE